MKARAKKKKERDALNQITELLPECKSMVNDVEKLRSFDIHLINIINDRVVSLETKIRCLKFDIEKTYVEADRAFKLLVIALAVAYFVLSYCFVKTVLN